MKRTLTTSSKLFLVFILLVVGSNWASAQNDHDAFLSKTFRKVIKTDQSHVRNNAVRDTLVRNNFDLINSLLADSVNLNTNQALKKRTHRRLKTGLVITFIHILQIDPKLLLNEATSDFLAEQIAQKRIGSNELKSALGVYQVDVDNKRWSEESMSYFTERLESVKAKWKIE